MKWIAFAFRIFSLLTPRVTSNHIHFPFNSNSGISSARLKVYSVCVCVYFCCWHFVEWMEWTTLACECDIIYVQKECDEMNRESTKGICGHKKGTHTNNHIHSGKYTCAHSQISVSFTEQTQVCDSVQCRLSHEHSSNHELKIFPHIHKLRSFLAIFVHSIHTLNFPALICREHHNDLSILVE